MDYELQKAALQQTLQLTDPDARKKMAQAVFPFAEMREGQYELMQECFRDIKAGKRLFAEAPTGIGKTISALYPAVRALGQGYVDKIFYLTAKNATASQAFDVCRRFFQNDVPLRVVMLSSKEQICPRKSDLFGDDRTGAVCTSHTCGLMGNYQSRAYAALQELIPKHHGYDPKTIADTAASYQICPHEFSLDVSEFCQVIICDYNYVFDQAVWLKRYFTKETGQKYVFLIDEAHNLPSRIRAMYTTELKLSSVLSVAQYMPPESHPGPVRDCLARIVTAMQACRKNAADDLVMQGDGIERAYITQSDPPAALNVAIDDTVEKGTQWLRSNRDHPAAHEFWELLVNLRSWQGIMQYYNRDFLTCTEIDGREIIMRLFCRDPSSVADLCLSRARAAMLFSATLTPTDYFAQLLGGEKNSACLSLPSPFPRDNLCVAVADGVNTRFEERAKNAPRLVSYIAAMLSGRKGHYLVYLPSYQYLETVYAAFIKKYPKIPVLRQERNMTRQSRTAFLQALGADDGSMLLGFCVLGGSFSEGIDIPGNRLIGVMIVGTGLPGISNELQILQEYADMKYENGYRFTHVYPGMNRVLQAAGRVIRTEKDRGVVILADDRYNTPEYRTLFPPHWKNALACGNATSMAALIQKFWNKARQ